MENRSPSWLESYAPKRKPKLPRGKRKENPRPKGRPALTDIHQNFVNTVKSIVKENGYEAHRRRNSTTGMCGLTLSSLREQVLLAEPAIAETNPSLSLNTISRTLQPPNKKFRASALYKGQVQAKVPPKRNDARKKNINAHYYSARVKYCLEAASMFSQQSMVLSVDNKNKVRVGRTTLAVDRRIKLRRVFPLDDAPQYLDHDFPTPGYLITPSGYLEMRSNSQKLCSDELGRTHFKLPVASSITVKLRGPHSSCNLEDHVADMLPLIRKRTNEGVRFLVVISDGGPDYNPNHIINQLFWSRLFRQSGLDGMVVTTYCPGYSALNPVEHLWAPLTHAIAAVYLPDTLPGEDQPPSKQNLPDDEKKCKEHSVFNHAMKQLKLYWDKVCWNGMVPDVTVVPSENSGGLYKTYHAQVNGPVKMLCPELRDEFDFMTKHMDRRIGQLIFSKCLEACEKCPNQENSDELLKLLRTFPSPIPCPNKEEHFMTFRDTLQVPREETDKYMPQVASSQLGRCTSCRSYMFSSKTNARNHGRLSHPKR